MSETCKANEACETVHNDECCCDMPERLLCLADEAWYEVLKEKMKDEIRKSCGENMDKLAKLVVGTNKAKWAHMVKGKIKCDEYKQNLKNIFASVCNE